MSYASRGTCATHSIRRFERYPDFPLSLFPWKKSQVAPSRVDKDGRVARLARIPFAGLSVGEEGPITHPLPRNSVLTERDAYLLRLVVVSTGIEHDIGVDTQADRGRFNAVPFPRQLRFENALRAPLPPMLCGKIARKRRAVNAEHLNLELWIARRPIAEQFIPDDVGFGIDRAAAVPVRRGAIWDCRQIVRMSYHHYSWRGRSRREGPYRRSGKRGEPGHPEQSRHPRRDPWPQHRHSAQVRQWFPNPTDPRSSQWPGPIGRRHAPVESKNTLGSDRRS